MYPTARKRRGRRPWAASLLFLVAAACGGGGGGDGESSPPPPNQPPVADAGGDFDAVERETVTLQSASVDPDGAITGWSWEQTGGPAVGLSDADQKDASFTAPVVTDTVELEFTLTVTDDDGDTASDALRVAVHPNEPPELAVDFPCNGCRVSGSALSVTGTAGPGADAGHTAEVDGIEAVTVEAGDHAVQALVQTDGRWVAQNLPLPGDSTTLSLSITATDRFGESDSTVLPMEYAPTLPAAFVATDPVTANRAYLLEAEVWITRLFRIDLATGLLTLIREFGLFDLGQVTAIDIDASASRLFMAEYTGTIHVVDLATGAMATVSGAATGSGPSFDRVLGLAFDDDDERVIGWNDDPKALFAVDVATGARAVVSDNTGAGTGDLFFNPAGLALDPANDIAYLHQPPDDFVIVELGTGNRSTLPKSGDAFNGAVEIGYDAARNALAVVDREDQVIQVDLATGARTVISDGASHPGFELGGFPWQLTYDALGDRYVISDLSINGDDTDRLIGIDPGTGTRSVLFDNHLGTGAEASGAGEVALDAAGGQVYLAASDTGNIVRVDLATGERYVVADAATGTGSPIGTPGDIALDLPGNRLFVIDSSNATLVAVTLDSGNRMTLASDLIGTGPGLSIPVALAADLANERVYVLDQGIPAIVAVDLASGERTIVSDASNSGPALVSFYGALLDADNNRLLISDTGDGSTVETRLVAVDLATGDRTTLSGWGVGSGPFLNDLRTVARADEPTRVIVSSFDRFYLVDLTNGDRQVIAGPETGNGENPFGSMDVVYDPAKRVFYSWDQHYEALFQYDLTTGDRVAVSH